MMLFINGKLAQVQRLMVVPDQIVQFLMDFPHGRYDVKVRFSDTCDDFDSIGYLEQSVSWIHDSEPIAADNRLIAECPYVGRVPIDYTSITDALGFQWWVHLGAAGYAPSISCHYLEHFLVVQETVLGYETYIGYDALRGRGLRTIVDVTPIDGKTPLEVILSSIRKTFAQWVSARAHDAHKALLEFDPILPSISRFSHILGGD